MTERVSLQQHALTCFAQGYIAGLKNERAFYDTSLASVDDWLAWHLYDINFVGKDSFDEMADTDVKVIAYPRDWVDTLPEPLFSFIVKGETK